MGAHKGTYNPDSHLQSTTRIPSSDPTGPHPRPTGGPFSEESYLSAWGCSRYILCPNRQGGEAIGFWPKIACWNARGIMPGSLYLDELLNKQSLDICAISEHWLFPNNITFLGSVNSKYDFVGKSDIELIDHTTVCKTYQIGKGGVALWWNKTLSHSMSVIDTDGDRIIGIDISLRNDAHLVIFSVCLPSANLPNDMFCEYIQKMSDLYSQYFTYASVVFLGDMNTQINGQRCVTTKQSRVQNMYDFFYI